MLLSRLKLELRNTSIGSAGQGRVLARVVVLSVDQDIVRRRDPAVQGPLNKAEIVGMVPILENDRPDVDIVVGMLGPIDDHRTVRTARVLSAVVA